MKRQKKVQRIRTKGCKKRAYLVSLCKKAKRKI